MESDEQFKALHATFPPPRPGKNLVIAGERPPPSSAPVSPQMKLAKTMAERLFKLLPPLDVIDPESFMAETISFLSGYPIEVMERAAHEIPRRTDRPTLRLIKAACDELLEPIDRELERRWASESHRLGALPRPKRTPEQQARIDAQVAVARQQLGIPEGAKTRAPYGHRQELGLQTNSKEDDVRDLDKLKAG